MKEYAGKPDPKYGGIVTNVCELPVGTKFYVYNGAWTGKICQDDAGKYVRIEGCSPKRFKNGDEMYLAIKPIDENYYETTNAINNNTYNSTTIIHTVNRCSICKNKNSKKCNSCCIDRNNAALPSNFLADISKINPHFVDSYYELLNKYVQLNKTLGIEIRNVPYDIGE